MDTSDTLDSIDQDLDGIKSENGSKDDDLGVKSGGIKKQPSKATIRRRNNARIKKLVAPKAPIQVLNELVGPGNVKFNIQTPDPGMMAINSPRLLIAEVVVEGQTFSGSGPSRPARDSPYQVGQVFTLKGFAPKILSQIFVGYEFTPNIISQI